MTTTDQPTQPAPEEQRSGSVPSYLGLGFIIGAAVLAALGVFLYLYHQGEHLVWDALPHALGMDKATEWLVIVILMATGIVVALIRHLPGGDGHDPIDGFATQPFGVPELLKVLGMAVASLAGGIVLGPEAPMIAICVSIPFLLRKHLTVPFNEKTGWWATAIVTVVAAAAVTFAPLGGWPAGIAVVLFTGAACLGPTGKIRLVAGALALIAIRFMQSEGLLSHFQLELSKPPSGSGFTWAALGWAIPIGAVGGLLAVAIRKIGRFTQHRADIRPPIIVLPVMGFLIGVCAAAYSAITHNDVTDILFDGEASLQPLANKTGTVTVSVLLLMILFKSIAYGLSLGSGFRGGPVFPSLFVGACLGLLGATVLPGTPPLAGYAMGMAAVCAGVLGSIPVAVILVIWILAQGGLSTIPVVVVAAAIAFAVRKPLDPLPSTSQHPTDGETTKAPAASAAGPS